MATFYWVGAAGSWSSSAKWASSSGGVGGAGVPTAADTVIIDANSNTGTTAWTITLDVQAACTNLTLSNDATLTFSNGNIAVSGTTTINTSSSTIGVNIPTGSSLGDLVVTRGLITFTGTTNATTIRTLTSTSALARTIAFGTNTSVTLTGNNTTIWNVTNAGTSTMSGVCTVNCNYSGSTGTRTIISNADTGAVVPTFKVAAGSDIVSIGGTSVIKGLNTTGFTGTLTWADSTSVTFYNSITFGNHSIASGKSEPVYINTNNTASNTSFQFTNPYGLTIRSNVAITLPSVSYGWTLSSNLIIGDSYTLTLTSGTLIANGYNIFCGGFVKTTSSTSSILNTQTSSITRTYLTGSNMTILNVVASGISSTGSRFTATYAGSTGTRRIVVGSSLVPGGLGLCIGTSSGDNNVIDVEPSQDILQIEGGYDFINAELAGNNFSLPATVYLNGPNYTNYSNGATQYLAITAFPNNPSKTVTGTGTINIQPTSNSSPVYYYHPPFGSQNNLVYNAAQLATNIEIPSNINTTGSVTFTRGTITIKNNSTITCGSITATAASSNLSVLVDYATCNVYLTNSTGTVISVTSNGIANPENFNLFLTGSAGAGRSISMTRPANVYINGASTDTVSFISAPSTVGILDLSGFTGTLSAQLTLNVYGSINIPTSVAGTTLGTNSSIYLKPPTSGTASISIPNKTLDTTIVLDAGSTGVWNLSSDLTLATGKLFSMLGGSLFLNNYNLTVGVFNPSSVSSTTTRTIGAGSYIGDPSGTGKVIIKNNTTNTVFDNYYNLNTFLGHTNLPIINVAPVGSTASQVYTIRSGDINGSNYFNFELGGDAIFPYYAFSDGSHIGSLRLLNVAGQLNNTYNNTYTIHGNFTIDGTTPTLQNSNGTVIFTSPVTQNITTNGKSIPFPMLLKGYNTSETNQPIRVLDNLTNTNTLYGIQLDQYSYLELFGNITAYGFNCGGSYYKPIYMKFNSYSLTVTNSLYTANGSGYLKAYDTPRIRLIPPTSSTVYYLLYFAQDSVLPPLNGGISGSGVTLENTSNQTINISGNFSNIDLTGINTSVATYAGTISTIGNVNIPASTTSFSQLEVYFPGNYPLGTATPSILNFGGGRLKGIRLSRADVTYTGSSSLQIDKFSIDTGATSNNSVFRTPPGLIIDFTSNSGTNPIYALGGNWYCDYITINIPTLGESTSLVYVPNNFFQWTNDFTINISSSNTNNQTQAIYGNNSYGTININNTHTSGVRNIHFMGSNSINKLKTMSIVRTTGLMFGAGTTQNIGTFEVKGSAGNMVQLTPYSAGTTYTLNKTTPGPVTEADYLTIIGSTATPSDVWYAGANSVNGGSNSGWIFAAFKKISGAMLALFF